METNMTQKRIITRRLSEFQSDILNKSGGVPLGWLSSLAQKVKAEVLDSEESSCMVHGLDDVTVTWAHTLTPVEQLESRLAELAAAASTISDMLPREGAVSLTEEQTDRIRGLLRLR